MRNEETRKKQVNKMRSYTNNIVGFLITVLLILSGGSIKAANLKQISDTLSDSGISESANHTVTFTLTNEIPASGKIIITPQATYFTVSSTLDYTDVDLKVDSAEKTLGATAGSGAGSAIGVAVTTGDSGSLTLTLNDTDAIIAGSVIIIKIGTNAEIGATGNEQIQNPSAVNSYTIAIQTKNSANVVLDSGTAMIATTQKVSVSGEVAAIPKTVEVTVTSGGGSPIDRSTDIVFGGKTGPKNEVVILVFWLENF